MTHVRYTGVGLPEDEYPDAADVEFDIRVDGEDEDVVEKVALSAREAGIRALQAFATGNHPELCDGGPVSVAWERLDAIDETPGPFPNGLYLIADTPKTATPLAVEDGSGDRGLLLEALDEHGVDAADYTFEDAYRCESCDNGPITVADFSHRTNVGYTAASIRCPSCDEPMKRVTIDTGADE